MPKAGTRHQSRQAALQILYQWEVGRISPGEAVERYWQIEQDAPALSDAARRFAEELALGTIEQVAAIDPLLEHHAQHWRLERMAVIDRLILRMAVFEFLRLPDTPRIVVIDEAIELARTYSEQEAVRFVNGVLDGIHRSLPAEAGDGNAADTM